MNQRLFSIIAALMLVSMLGAAGTVPTRVIANDTENGANTTMNDSSNATSNKSSETTPTDTRIIVVHESNKTNATTVERHSNSSSINNEQTNATSHVTAEQTNITVAPDNTDQRLNQGEE